MRKLSLLIFALAVVSGTFGLEGCSTKEKPLFATLVMKSDGSQYSGTVIRRESNSITVTGIGGETHTYLYSELADIKYGSPDDNSGSETATTRTSAPVASSTASAGTASPVAAGQAVAMEFPAGTAFAVRTNGFLDSCCVPEGANSLGVIDSDVRSGDGKRVLPAGASVTMVLVESRKVDGRQTMTFELGSADFGGSHYVINATKGGNTEGARITYNAAKEGTREGTERGLNIHIDDGAFMGFKALNAVTIRPSQ